MIFGIFIESKRTVFSVEIYLQNHSDFSCSSIYLSICLTLKVLPEYLSEWTTEKVKSEGVNVLPNSRIKGVKMTEGGRLEVELSGSKGRKTSIDKMFLFITNFRKRR